MSMKSLGLTLTLAIALITLGYVDTASAVKPGETCDINDPPVHPSCPKVDPDPDPDPDPTATFTVGVFLNADNVDDGSVTVTEVNSNGNRQGLNGFSVPDFNLVDVSQLPDGCGADFGAPNPASFSISTAKIPTSEDFLTFAVF